MTPPELEDEDLSWVSNMDTTRDDFAAQDVLEGDWLEDPKQIKSAWAEAGFITVEHTDGRKVQIDQTSMKAKFFDDKGVLVHETDNASEIEWEVIETITVPISQPA